MVTIFGFGDMFNERFAEPVLALGLFMDYQLASRIDDEKKTGSSDDGLLVEYRRQFFGIDGILGSDEAIGRSDQIPQVGFRDVLDFPGGNPSVNQDNRTRTNEQRNDD